MIKQPLYAVISLILLVVVTGYAIERLAFLKRAEHTTGTVTHVTSHNSQCSNRRSKYSCTQFNASVDFLARDSSKYTLRICAGSSRGHNQPLEYARVKVNDPVPVVYDPQNPTKAFKDTTGDVWGTPIMILIFQIGSFFTSLIEPKRRREE